MDSTVAARKVHSAVSGPAIRRLSLIDSLDDRWFKILLPAMQEVGPASQTLAALLKISPTTTFSRVELIAKEARLPIKTTRNHLTILRKFGWIENEGRGRTRTGKPRRTCTRLITVKTKKATGQYGILPLWATLTIRQIRGAKFGKRMPWVARAVLSVIMSRLASLKRVALDNAGVTEMDAKLIQGAIANLSVDDYRWQWSQSQLAEQTGLHVASVGIAKHWLASAGIVRLFGSRGRHGGTGRDILEASETFRLVVTPAGREGFFHLDFEG